MTTFNYDSIDTVKALIDLFLRVLSKVKNPSDKIREIIDTLLELKGEMDKPTEKRHNVNVLRLHALIIFQDVLLDE